MMQSYLIWRYAAFGTAFGLLFPALSVGLLVAWGPVSAPTPQGLLAAAHAHAPLLYLIDTAPVFLGLFAAFAGVRQQRVVDLNASLARQVDERTESLRAALLQAERTNVMISHMADHDPMTGLLNRRRMHKEIVSAVSMGRRHGDPFALVFLDLDRFKAVNDEHGHDAGDRLLAGVAGLLEQMARETDRVGRWGGDEFVILLPKSSRAGAAQFAARLDQCFAEQRIDIGPAGIHPRASVGIALFPDDGADPEGLLAFADQQMYQVKRRSYAVASGHADEVAA